MRQVLLRESYGNTYVSLLTTTIGAALLFIVALAVGWPATRLHALSLDWEFRGGSQSTSDGP